jgi:hypothetical protein
MAKVTYLIGAGASAKGVPTIKEFPERLIAFRKFMQENAVSHDALMEITKRAGARANKLYIEILETLTDIINNINGYTSIDSYAKELIDSEREIKYWRLKAVTSFFLIYEQIKSPVEPRYRSFLSNIGDGFRGAFKGDIKVVSWNYDYQFEKTYSIMHVDYDLKKIQESLRIFPNDRTDYPRRTDTFSIFKLNGTTSFKAPEQSKLVYPIDDLSFTDISQLPKRFLTFYFSSVFTEEFENMLSFAWEKNNKTSRNTLDVAKLSIENTQVLVIIGYSFPDFNINVDRELFEVLRPGLREIYIQDLDPARIKERIISRFLPDNENLKFTLEPLDKETPADFARPREIYQA